VDGVKSELRAGNATRKALVEQDGRGEAMFDISFTSGSRCFVLRDYGESSSVAALVRSVACPVIDRLGATGISGGNIRGRESMVWQVLPAENRVRTFRSNDGGELSTTVFSALPGALAAQVAGVVEFGEWWLVEWRSGDGRSWLALHVDSSGEAISTSMRSPVDGAALFDSVSHEGLRFLKWRNGKPVKLVTVPASVEWVRERE
jgi:hypothetical protein